MEKNYSPEINFKELNGQHYCFPRPIYPKKITEFEKLTYVVEIFCQGKKNNFEHATESLFRPIGHKK